MSASPDQPLPRSVAAAPDCMLDVLIPHYADPAGLEAALASIAAQDWLADPANRLRVIVVDDGTPADAFAEVEAICARFRTDSGQALRLERLARNTGRPAARNRLLDLAGAPYLAWLDAGDVWYPGKLRAQFAELARHKAAGADLSRIWVSCAYDWDQGGGRMIRTQDVAGDQMAALLMGDRLRAYLWTFLGHAEAFARAGRFDLQLPRLQDLDYCLHFVRAGGRIVMAPTLQTETHPAPHPLCCYFKSAKGRDARQVAASHARILKKHAPCIRRYPRGFRARLRQKGPLLAARFARSNGAYGLAMRYILAAVLVSPVHSLGATLGWIRGRTGRLRPHGRPTER